MNTRLLLLLDIVLIVLIVVLGVNAAYIMQRLIVPPAPASLSSTTVSPTGVPNPTSFYFLVFTQKGGAMLVSQDGSFLGYRHIFNISETSLVQTYWWFEVPSRATVSTPYMPIPLNNGTVIILNSTSLKVVQRISAGSSVGFIGVAISPDQSYAVIANGPSGIVEAISMSDLHVIWKQTFLTPSGSTAYPSDMQFSPDGKYVAVPMRLNDSVDLLSSSTGAIVSHALTQKGTEPFMLSISEQGTIMAVEYQATKAVAFYSLPSLTSLGTSMLPSPNFSPERGVFTPSGKYYLEASESSNQLAVVSTSDYKVARTIDLPLSQVPGLVGTKLTPDGKYAYVIQHGNLKTGGVIYLISLSDFKVTTDIPLSTAPAFALPVSQSYGTYLANSVFLAPLTDLVC